MLSKLITLLVIFAICSDIYGQTIEYRNDSLFVNNYYANAQTSKSTLDSLLKSIGQTKKSKADYPKCYSDRKVVRTTYFYYDLGLFFRKYDCDTSKLSVGIKLYNDSDRKYDKKNGELTNTFKGILLIGGDTINGLRDIQDLEKMKYCKVTISKVTAGSYTRIIGGDIIYSKNFIRLSFDSKTDQLTYVYIHHNFHE
jgi:hypothetical protein